MKWLITGAITVAITPILAVGTLMASYAATSDPGCSQSATSRATTSGCGAVPVLAPAIPFSGPDGYIDDVTSRGSITRRMLRT